MTVAVGQDAEVTEPWPIRPGAALSLQPGDRGRVVRLSATHAAIEVSGAVVVVPTTILRGPPSAPSAPATPGSDDSWFDGWAAQMDKHRQRRHRGPER